MSKELPSGICLYPLHPNKNANFNTYSKKSDFKAEFFNQDFKTQFIRHETPSRGEFLTYELLMYINIHPLNPKTSTILENLIKSRRF